MIIPSNNKTEHRALNALERIIDKHDTMDYQFNGNDKEMSWDGFIWLYKTNDGSQAKNNFDSRIPVQIKGHTDKGKKYINREKIKYQVDCLDLEAYRTEKGVLYFQVFLSDGIEAVFYASLFPSKINSYVNEAHKKKNKTVRIPFQKLSGTPDELFIITKQFSNEASKQGSGFNPLVEDMIELEEIEKLESISASVVGAHNLYEALQRMPSGDICFYGRRTGEKYCNPIDTRDLFNVSVSTEYEETIRIEQEKYYERYCYVETSSQQMIYQVSNYLAIDVNNSDFVLKKTGTIHEIGKDASFLLAVLDKGYFYAGEKTIELKNDILLDEDTENSIKFFATLSKFLDQACVNYNVKIQDIPEEQRQELNLLYRIGMGYCNKDLPLEIQRFNWSFNGKIVPLIIEKQKNDEYTVISSALYPNKYQAMLLDKDNKQNIVPMFCFYEPQLLAKLYNIDIKGFMNQVDISNINETTVDAINMAMLNMISAFDITGDEKFLEVAMQINFVLCDYVSWERWIINKLQIKKRQGSLLKEEIDDLKNIGTRDLSVMFGVNTLTECWDKAGEALSKMEDNEREHIESMPIYTLYNIRDKCIIESVE